MIPTHIKCPGCGREVAVVGKGAKAKLGKHNGMESARDTLGYKRRVSRKPCPQSGADAIAILIDRAEREHAWAKLAEDSACAALAKAQDEAKRAHDRVASTAAEIDRLREIKAGAR